MDSHFSVTSFQYKTSTTTTINYDFHSYKLLPFNWTNSFACIQGLITIQQPYPSELVGLFLVFLIIEYQKQKESENNIRI